MNFRSLDLVKPRDTTLDAIRVQTAILARMTPAERLSRMCAFNDEVRQRVEAGIRQRHPEYSDQQVVRTRAKLLLGDELYRQAYGDTEIEP